MEWKGVHENDHGLPTVLYIDGVGVARLEERIDGTWFAQLDYHRPQARTRDCSSYEAGRRGVEQWAQRHAERLARETAEVRANWPRLPQVRDAAPPAGPRLSPEEFLRQQAQNWGIEVTVTPRRRRRR